MGRDKYWQEDLARYPQRPWTKEQSIWAISVYRYGRRVDEMPRGLHRWLHEKWYWFIYRIIETATGISISKNVEIGSGLRIWHFGNIFIHPRVHIGANCTLRQGVTIGVRGDDGKVPVIGDNVDFGAYAQVLGGIRVGNNARIGAMSVVLQDVPDNATAVGIPARIIQKTFSSSR